MPLDPPYGDAIKLETPGGLSAEAARARLIADGPNSLPSQEKRSLAAIALSVLREPMFLLLCAAAGVYLIVGDLREALVLAASIVVVLAITIVQERRTERALEALRDLSSPRARVIRDGAEQHIAGSDVVQGDLVMLGEGDRVPADARLHDAHDLQIDESLLTGESVAVPKSAMAGEALVYSGTLVTKGRGRAIVIATGPRTELGRIGRLLQATVAEKTLLERETARTVKLFGALAIVMCVAMVVLYGIVRGEWLPAVLAGLTLAMSIVPEEFPVVLTVFLALGAWRIARRGVLTRRMPAVETLGAATVLCVDKTGTLTENRMAVAEVFAGGLWQAADTLSGAESVRVVETAALACEADPFDPMERAIIETAARASPVAERPRLSLEQEYPFRPGFLAVAYGWRAREGTVQLAMKGAPETVLGYCRLSEDERALASQEASRAAARGLRLLAIAGAPWQGNSYPDDLHTCAFEWLGFIALADPLRASVPAAVQQCRRAGIRVVMITGDYPATALAIARTAGLPVEGGVISGAELAAMTDEQCADAVRRVSVFARITPEQKLRLVTAYKAAGEVVAMTGDGVNDAPALRAAHIGIAMGRRGTDVAREAAALVLTDDDFGAIVDTVRLGRRIYENIRNAMRYLISVHVPIAGMAFLPILLGWPWLLFPVHVVFLEFAIDPACSIAFEAEPTEEDAMSRPPRDPAAPLFSAELLAVSLGIGVVMLAAVGAVYWWAVAGGRAEDEVRAMGFATIVLANVALILAVRSARRSVLDTLFRPNRALWWVIGGTAAALAVVLYVRPVAEMFRFAPIGAADLAAALLAGLSALAAVELLKRIKR